jgi:hypothetical protein
MPSSFIDGVYNYCDRWCERCPLTARCRLYATERRLDEGGEIDHAAFWASLGLRVPDDLGEEEDEPDFGGSAFEPTPDVSRDERARHPIAESAMQLSLDSHHWLRGHAEALELLPAESGGGVSPAEAVEVLNWYCLQIGVKLSRALSTRFADDGGEPWALDAEWQEGPDEIDEALEEAERIDRAGSAKVALLGIERSLGAWTVLRDALPGHDAEIVAFQRRLARLRRVIDESVPDARTFRRLGFEDGTLPGRD